MSNYEYQGDDSRLRKFIREYGSQAEDGPSPRNQNLSQSGQPSSQFNIQNEFFMNNDQRNNSDVRSLVQNLMKTKDLRSNQNYAYSSSRPILVNAEEKIFQEVINLLMEINQIKDNIQKQKDMTLQLEAERDHLLSKSNSKQKAGGKKIADFEMDSIINKLKSREGDDYRISMTQLEKIAAENEHLQIKINRLKIQYSGNAKQILEQERQRYLMLRSQLEEKKSELDYEAVTEFETQNLMSQIKKVENDIERLKGQGVNQPNIQNEIHLLNEENQRLRDKTVKLLQQTDQEEEDEGERRRLEEYIRQEEENKLIFLEDLKRFKAEYNQLLEENARLKKEAGRRNNSRQGDERLFKYHDLVSEMQSVMK